MKKIFNSLKSLLIIRNQSIFILISVLLLGLFFFFISLNNVHTQAYDIERFGIADETIRSPLTFEKEQETERETREAIQSVEDKFEISDEMTEERVEYVEEIFDALEKSEEEIYKLSDVEDENTPVPMTNDEKVQQLKQLLSPEISDAVRDEIWLQLLELSSHDREEGKMVFVDSLKESLEKGVRSENIATEASTLKQSIEDSDLDQDVKEPLYDLSEFAIVENSFFDVEQTMDERREAANSIEPVVIRAGDIIVREGQTITNEVYEELDFAGLLSNERNVYPIIGLALLITLIISVIAYEMVKLAKQNKLDQRKMISIVFISIMVISLMKAISLYTVQGSQMFYLVPVATGVLLVKQLINERFAVILCTLYAILGSIIFNGEIPGSLNFEVGIYFFFAQLAGILFLTDVKDRLAILKAGIGMAVVNVITVLLFIFLSFENYALEDVFTQAGFGIAAAFFSAVLTIGLLPFFETVLGVLTDSKLLQLSNPNQPLLKKILTEAPGTYHHSVMVANLSETACEAIGANGLLARVGSYYHDIGKTVRPHYFIENQLSINNPHDVIAPRQSAEIIINHPYDGADMLKKYKLPKDIIDIAQQHHGTTLLKYFYYKEKEGNKLVKEKQYRYPGPKPQSKEAAIICICDSVEAAVRSLNEPTEEKIEEIVASIVNDRMMDGQFDDTPITLRDLKIIRLTICEALKGIFHSRIQYPIKEAK
ncbi:putative nucleotidyltransferase with HDIG domain [Virgibacillus natechei]|uniref:Nucleotidyltransferase with HDIG domain n=1 Tax=Virgibacillus natechei TaxID=1216297 RepID=A0ABS4ICN6_9BACI|nr:HDIG domain-containing metalloprotein [Virgibacillus natechei]MBP1968702.1 putative nucleotidyltransferase with HDIG domain [Virgibacillus natechei]UZD11504.1 HDIG domain-containing protein [Virgibacillus natechei]